MQHQKYETSKVRSLKSMVNKKYGHVKVRSRKSKVLKGYNLKKVRSSIIQYMYNQQKKVKSKCERDSILKQLFINLFLYFDCYDKSQLIIIEYVVDLKAIFVNLSMLHQPNN